MPSCGQRKHALLISAVAIILACECYNARALPLINEEQSLLAVKQLAQHTRLTQPISPPRVQEEAVLGLFRRLFPVSSACPVKLSVKIHGRTAPDGSDIGSYEADADVSGSTLALHVEGTNGVAGASALYAFLKSKAGMSVTWTEDQLEWPSDMSRLVVSHTDIKSNGQFSYYENVCTVSYSMVWWQWDRWERELDWAALHGVNLMLAFSGQERVWQNVWLRQGMSVESLDKFFSGPGFFAWQRMGNLRGWGGNLSEQFMNAQEDLQTRILARMHEFGITPVLPAFAGFVPEAWVKLHPEANVSRAPNWNNFPDKYCCDYQLEPNDPTFIDIGSQYVEEQAKLYGNVTIFYNTDTFNELNPASSDPEYLKQSSSAVFKALTSGNPNAIWLMQGWLFYNERDFWQEPQIQGYLSGVPDDRMVVLDLMAEVHPVWKKLQNKPFIWCMLHNFGGNLGMYGKMSDVARLRHESSHASNFAGVGITPEGINQNVEVYELALDQRWASATATNVERWTHSWAAQRWGTFPQPWDTQAQSIAQSLRSTVLECPTDQRGVVKSLVTLRPSLDCERNMTINFMVTDLYYKPNDLRQVWQNLVRLCFANREAIANRPAIQYDLADLTRQVLSDSFLGHYHEFKKNYFLATASFEQHEIKAVDISLSKLLDIILQMDKVMCTQRTTLLSSWISHARQWGSSSAEKDDLEFNARNQISLWGPKGQIKDYASKQWCGMLRSFYFPRWEFFAQQVNLALSRRQVLNSSDVDKALERLEEQWNSRRSSTFKSFPDEGPQVPSETIMDLKELQAAAA